MIEAITNILLFPFAWAVETTIVFAVTAPINHIYIAMGVALFLATLLIWSMIPKKVTSHNIEPMIVTPYVATEEDEAEARRILIEAQAL